MWRGEKGVQLGLFPDLCLANAVRCAMRYMKRKIQECREGKLAALRLFYPYLQSNATPCP